MVKEIVKQVIICDRCGRQLAAGEKIGYVAVHQRLEVHGDAVNKNEFEEMDFCEKCLCDITRYVACNPAGTAESEKDIVPQAVPMPEKAGKAVGLEEKAQQKKKTAAVAPAQTKRTCRRSIDYGKILALSNAGWDNKKIAEEMGMTCQQVSDAKWKAKKKQEAGKLVLGDNYL